MAMIGSLAQGLVGMIVDEVAAQGGRRMQQEREGSIPYHQHHHQQQQQQQQQRQLPPGPLASFVESISILVSRAVAAALTGLQYLLLFEALLLSAVVLYGALYWLMMPLRLHDKPIFFDYSSRATVGGATGTVDFLARHTQWDPSPLTTVDRLNTKVLEPGQHYKVGLELHMPTSYTNRKVGVFMVHTTLLDDEGNELARSARPAMLPHTSALRKGLGMFFSWPLYLAGFSREEETVYVDCIDFYEENALHPLTKARVTVSSGRVQFYRSSINITPQLKGIPWLMHNFFYSTLAAGVLFIASLELMAFGFCYVLFFLRLEEPNNSNGSGSKTIGSTANVRRTVSISQGNSNRRAPAILPGGGRADDDNHGGAEVSPNSTRRSWNLPAPAGTTAADSGRDNPPAEADEGFEAPSARAAAVPGATSATGGTFHQDEGLRRRSLKQVRGGAGGAGGAATTNSRRRSDSGSASSLTGKTSSSSLASWLQEAAAAATTTTNRKRQEASALPPGVQTYQRGARYVIQGSRPVTGGVSGTAAGSGGGSGDGVELDVAALASWAALDGNIIEPRREAMAFERQGPGGAAAIVNGRGSTAQSARVVECENATGEAESFSDDDVAGSGISKPIADLERDVGYVETEGSAVAAAPGGWRVLDLSRGPVDTGNEDKP